MFNHSIKVPRLYKNASKVLKDWTEGKGSVRQLVFDTKHPNIKAIYALVVETSQRHDIIEHLLRKSKFTEKEPKFDPVLARILITELLWGKKRLTGESKPVKIILGYEQIFKAHLSDIEDIQKPLMQVSTPRYVRINTLKMSTKKAVDAFRDEGWILCRETPDYSTYLSQISSLKHREFAVDFHIDDMLVFPPKTQFHNHPAYIYKQIILQDKASCLSVHILQPEPGSTVLDMCAAPGMKTTQLAAKLQNKGTIYAVELCEKRFQVLKSMVQNAGATCVKTINEDVLTLSDNHFPGVQYILVDPSCSGSGMLKRLELGQSDTTKDTNRLTKLAGFQIKILRHALTRFPQAKRVVYSTCSIYPEENEDVVRQVLETSSTFKLVPAQKYVKDAWPNCGSSDFGGIGEMCLYARPEIDCTNGFFVAVFERLEEDETNKFFNKDLFKWQKKMDKKVQQEEASANDSDEADSPESKHRRRKSESNDTECSETEVDGAEYVDDRNEPPVIYEEALETSCAESSDLVPDSNATDKFGVKKKRKKHRESRTNDNFSSSEYQGCKRGEMQEEAIANSGKETDLSKSKQKRRKSKRHNVGCIETQFESTVGLADNKNEAPNTYGEYPIENCTESSDVVDTNMTTDSSCSKRKKKIKRKEPDDVECSETELQGTEELLDGQNEAPNIDEQTLHGIRQKSTHTVHKDMPDFNSTDSSSAEGKRKKKRKEFSETGVGSTIALVCDKTETPNMYEENGSESLDLVDINMPHFNSTDNCSTTRKTKKKHKERNDFKCLGTEVEGSVDNKNEAPTIYTENCIELLDLVNSKVPDFNPTDSCRTKKKKKSRIENGFNDSFSSLEYESSEMSHQYSETLNTSKEKQKKRKKSKEVVEAHIENDIAVESPVTENGNQTSRKRKRGRSNVMDANDTNIEENPSESALGYDNFEDIPKKKKRKRDTKDIECQNGDFETLHVQSEGSFRTHSKKRSKKDTTDVDETHKYCVKELIEIGNSIIEDSDSLSKEKDALASQ